jgi:DNA-binding PadR family transcriptional regulator
MMKFTHDPGRRGSYGEGRGPRWRHHGRHGGFPGLPGFFGGPKARRGSIRFFVLEVLAEGPLHGYEILRRIEERRGIRPSPGSIYPTLEALEEQGLVSSSLVEEKRNYAITDAGREFLAKRPAEEPDGEPDPRSEVREAAWKLANAVMSARGSDDAQLAQIKGILDKARREIYALLAAEEA